jgi:hypothetical protein
MIIVTVILLIVAQSVLLFTFKTASEDLATVRSQLNSLKKTQDERLKLVKEYTGFELIASRPGRQDALFPATELDLYTMVDRVLTANGIEHTNRTASREKTPPGGEMRLDITFSGPYYNILKALAAFRDEEFVMRVSEFNISSGQSDGAASGSMTIVSKASS